MSESLNLSKSELGLSKVRNQTVPSLLEFEIIKKRANSYFSYTNEYGVLYDMPITHPNIVSELDLWLFNINVDNITMLEITLPKEFTTGSSFGGTLYTEGGVTKNYSIPPNNGAGLDPVEIQLQVQLSGGVSGRPFFIKVNNLWDQSILWTNLATQGARNVGLEIVDEDSSYTTATTLLEIVKLDMQYFLLSVIRFTS